jgi:hypothetical protein
MSPLVVMRESPFPGSVAATTLPGAILDPGKGLEIGVHRPDRGLMSPRRREDHAVGHGQPVLNRNLSG